MANNRALLRAVVNATGLAGVVKVHDVAALNVNSRMRTKRVPTGFEGNGLGLFYSREARTEGVEVVTLDTFFEREKLPGAYISLSVQNRLAFLQCRPTVVLADPW